MKPLTRQHVQRKCKRCNRHLTHDIICPACKNELIAMYDNKLGWKTAYEIEKISRIAMRNTQQDDADEFD
jgi:uncharacterized paraquat-inducible protein A